jgi:hypothetical protein
MSLLNQSPATLYQSVQALGALLLAALLVIHSAEKLLKAVESLLRKLAKAKNRILKRKIIHVRLEEKDVIPILRERGKIHRVEEYALLSGGNLILSKLTEGRDLYRTSRRRYQEKEKEVNTNNGSTRSIN